MIGILATLLIGTIIDDVIKQGKQEQKYVVIYFGNENCPWCNKMLANTLTNSFTKKLSKDILILKLNTKTHKNTWTKIKNSMQRANQSNITRFIPCYFMIDPYTLDIEKVGNGFKTQNEFLQWISN